MTNVQRTVGTKAAILTLLGDVGRVEDNLFTKRMPVIYGLASQYYLTLLFCMHREKVVKVLQQHLESCSHSLGVLHSFALAFGLVLSLPSKSLA